MGTVNTNPFDFWHLETLKSQSNIFLNYLSPNAEDNFNNEISSMPSITENPSIWNSPVVFVRKELIVYGLNMRRQLEEILNKIILNQRSS